MLGQRIVSTPTIPMNLTTQLTHVNKGGQGLHLSPLVDPIGHQLTNMAVIAFVIHG